MHKTAQLAPNNMSRLSSFLLVSLLVSVLGAGCGHVLKEQYSSQPLPKIRIAKGQRTFVTENEKPFVPIGVNYYRPGTGWAPQVWKKFDAEATRRDFVRMRASGVTCVRVFLSYGSFYTHKGQLNPEGLEKFDRFLEIAEQAGIYVHPTGPDHWEGPPSWGAARVEDSETVEALEVFWKLFAARYRGRNVIFAYDLKNEPEVGWGTPSLRNRWKAWVQQKYATPQNAARAWGTNTVDWDSLAIPAEKAGRNDPMLLDFQKLRETLADDWTRRQVAAIKAADPEALVTVGLIQWSVPSLLPAGPRHYSAFRPERQAPWLDFLEVHFYPLADGVFQYTSQAEEISNLAYLEGVVREVARHRKPVVLAEFGWYGGGKPTFGGGKFKPATEEQQAEYCRRAVETSAGFVVGWLNWGYYDHPGATDCSELTGLLKPDGTEKAWGRVFRELSRKYDGKRIAPAKIGPRPELDWPACVTDRAAGDKFREAYRAAFEKDRAPRSL
jgi:endo-1,4-beta-mannosidase